MQPLRAQMTIIMQIYRNWKYLQLQGNKKLCNLVTQIFDLWFNFEEKAVSNF